VTKIASAVPDPPKDATLVGANSGCRGGEHGKYWIPHPCPNPARGSKNTLFGRRAGRNEENGGETLKISGRLVTPEIGKIRHELRVILGIPLSTPIVLE
jgi:hypothetical protein